MRERRLQDFGSYRIVRQLAVGGMAEIYLARHRGLEGIERTVVLKRVLERYAHDAEFATMFLDEARLMAALSHPNIAQVFDVGQVDRSYYLVMEHVRGPTLGKLLALWMRHVVGFSIGPLRVASLLGLALSGVGLVSATGFLVERLRDPSLPVGWASVIVSVTLLGGVQLFALGVIGEYLGRLVHRVAGAPAFVVRRTVGCEPLPIAREVPAAEREAS